MNLEGKVFGRWKVVSYKGKRNSRDIWLCQCECGTTKEVQQRILLNGKSKSCGCSSKDKIKDITGETFGRLTVISFAYTKDKRSYWNCVCTCGNTVILNAHKLTSGNTKSCGCLHSGNCESIKERSALTSGNTTSCGCKQYKESDTKELAEKLKKHKSSILKAKKDVFGGNISVLNEEQVKELEKHFKLKKHQESSKGEKEVASFVKSIYNGKVIENDREVIQPKELDIYIPEKHFAIEYNGLYWHSEKNGCNQTYHLNKTRKCTEQGIRLLHIYSDEWRDKKEIVKSMIASALGVYDRKIFARNCTVKEVKNKKVVEKLFNENHLQGTVSKYEKAIGLFYGKELVQCCLFGKQHFGKTNEIELYRMVTLKNVQVLGGFSKLMKHSGYNKVMSYVSLRTFNASGYYNSGWKLIHIAKPSYCYTDGFDTYSRHLFKKDKCLKRFTNVTDGMTEKEMTTKNGFYKVWDCGTYKVEWVS